MTRTLRDDNRANAAAPRGRAGDTRLTPEEAKKLRCGMKQISRGRFRLSQDAKR